MNFRIGTNSNKYLLLAILLIVLSGCISPSPDEIWCTPEYFKRITGIYFKAEKPPLICQTESWPDLSGIMIIKLPNNAKTYFENPPSNFWSFPMYLDYEKKRHIQTWRNGKLRTIDERIFKFIKVSIKYLAAGECSSESLRKSAHHKIESLLGKETTYYAYQYKTLDTMISMATFYIIDTTEGNYYEITHDL